jgi:hypothetical protein
VPFHGVRFAGRRFDCGDKAGFIEANLAFALARPAMRERLKGVIRRMAAEMRDGGRPGRSAGPKACGVVAPHQRGAGARGREGIMGAKGFVRGSAGRYGAVPCGSTRTYSGFWAESRVPENARSAW